MSKKYDVVAITGEYEKNGEKKLKYKNVGLVYEKNGKFGLMMDTPIVLDDEGNVVKFFSLFEPRAKDEPKQPSHDFDDGQDIPF